MPLLLMVMAAHSQTIITYNEDFTNFSNPERGMYYYTTTNENGTPNTYTALTASDISAATANGGSLIWRVFRLDDFKTVTNPASNANFATFKTKMAADFALMRANGVKCIIRFCYTEQLPTAQVPLVPDASKAVVLADIAELRSVTTAYSDVISSIEAGFIGTYGEWAYSGNFGNSGSLNSTNIAHRVEVGRAIVGLTSTTGLTTNRSVAFRTPEYQQMIINAIPALTGSTKARIAAHNDCFRYDIDDNGTYTSSPITLDQSFLETQSALNFNGGETCRDLANPELFYGVTDTKNDFKRFHFNYLNGAPYVEIGGMSPLTYWSTQSGANGNFLAEIRRKLGYRFVLKSTKVENNSLITRIENVGFGNLINPRNAFLILRKTTAPFTEYPLGFDYANPLNKSFVGADDARGVVVATPLGSVPNGTYDLFLRFPDLNATLSTDNRYSIQFANTNTYSVNGGSPITSPLPFYVASTGRNNLFRQVVILNGTASRMRNEDVLQMFEINAYPNPFNNSFKLRINTSGEETITIQAFDMIGRLIDSRQISISDVETSEIGSNYPAGIYNVLVSQGENVKTLRIIKQ